MSTCIEIFQPCPSRIIESVLLAAFGGLRRGELLGLTWRDIDLLHRTVTVRVQRQETKAAATGWDRQRPMQGDGRSCFPSA